MRVVISAAVGDTDSDGTPRSLVLSERSTFIRAASPDDEEFHLEVVRTTLEALDLVTADVREQVRRLASQFVGPDWREVRERLSDDPPPGPAAG